jgi:hypothetical protein
MPDGVASVLTVDAVAEVEGLVALEFTSDTVAEMEGFALEVIDLETAGFVEELETECYHYY